MILPYQQNLKDAGISEDSLRQLASELTPVVEAFLQTPPPEAKAIFACTREDESLAQGMALAEQWRKRFSHMVVIGSGGSGQSARALSRLRPGLPGGGDKQLHVLDTLDPCLFDATLRGLPLQETCFLAISKSGSTVETYAQASLLFAALTERRLSDLKDRVAAITVSKPNPLRTLAESMNAIVLEHPLDLCGRFSILSPVGLIPAAFLGLNPHALRKGAQASLKENLKSLSPAVLGAALQAAQMRQGKDVSVLFSYSKRLWGLVLWWRQSWAESLGKNGQGSTPLAALGPADQHSQLQLWLDGPPNKFYTVLGVGSEARYVVPEISGPLAYLSGISLSAIVDAQRRATEETLVRHRRPLRRIYVPKLDEYALGALIMHFTLEILFIAALLNVNPFDQPAVEESKSLAHVYLTKE